METAKNAGHFRDDGGKLSLKSLKQNPKKRVAESFGHYAVWIEIKTLYAVLLS